MGDLYLMREVALQGGRLGFLDKIKTEEENDTPLLIGSENWEDICVMVEEYEGDLEKSFDSASLKQEREKSKKYVLGLLRRKEINVKEFIKVQEILIALGRIEHLHSQFYMFKHVMDNRAKKCALRIKNQYEDYEPFHLVLYYFATDFNRSLKKAANGLVDCLIMCIQQLKREIYLSDRRLGRLKEEYDAHEIYLQSKGVNFSVFFNNSYLYYNIYKFLSHCNKLNLSELFLKCSIQEMFRDIAKMSNEDLKSMSILELTIMNKILISMNVAGDLSNHI